MSTRKLQQEFDKTHKKIAEGLAVFDDIHAKLVAHDAPPQKDKLELDLKKEIKRLQRLRDSLKQWLADASIKLDKGPLQESRSRIEHAMDQFKELERLSKIKQFLNEGLELQRAKLGRFGDTGEEDSKKQQVYAFISDSIDLLNQQNDLLEAQTHLQAVLLKKAKASQQPAIQTIMNDTKLCFDRNVKHLTRLEKILRGLENDRVAPEAVEDIKEDIEYYVHNNQDQDFVEYDDFYDLLNLDDDDLNVQGSLVHTGDEPETAEPRQARHASVGTTASSDDHAVPTPATLGAAPPPGFGGPVHRSRSYNAAPLAPAAPPKTEPFLPGTNHTFVATVPRLAHLARERQARPLASESISQLLEQLLLNCPDSFDAEKPRQYEPVHMHPLLVDYPQEPMFELNLAHMMRRFDVDTLLFCFYYGGGGGGGSSSGYAARYQAAVELTRRGWVYNRDTSQWFIPEPRAKGWSAAAAPGGTSSEADYKYFDYEKTWLMRRKEKYQFAEGAKLVFLA